MKRKKILLVEDEKAIQILIVYNLKKFGLEVELKENAESALEYLNHQTDYPDLIISDVLLPGMNGVNFCKVLKNTSEISEIPFILLSSVDYDFYRDGAASAGADLFMTKPFRIKDFLNAINELGIN
ncbi:MAG: response regulator [Ignavibacteria bacterium]|nr:response regulator [Ignavibacteria bacterium]